MTVGAIVQARMSSQRLPGKVLTPIHGKPMLQYTLERVTRAAGCTTVLVATSVERSDDPIAEFCAQSGVRCFRGSLEDVAGRFLAAAESDAFDAFVRICGDSPLSDPAIMDRAVEQFRSGAFDLVTNTFPRSFPKGCSVEVVRTATFRSVHARVVDAADREHVTRYYYQHPEEFRIGNFSAADDRSAVQLSVDTPEDLAAITRIIGAMTAPHVEYDTRAILDLHDALRIAV